jgi:EAL domain-containing protein (putative c-di-GMP-specific phosphodiesterase class I)
MVASLAKIVDDLGIASLAEGVETEAEHEVCRQMGFKFAQGFYYGRPALAGTFATTLGAENDTDVFRSPT